MTSAAKDRRRILIMRSYLSAEPDAVTQAVATLASALAADGHAVAALVARRGAAGYPVPELTPLPRVVGSRLAASRMVEQVTYLVAATVWLLWHRRSWDVLITVDTPPGVAIPAAIGRRLPGGSHLRHVAWVLDLFRLEHLAAEGKGGRLRQRAYLAVEGRSLRLAQVVVSVGSCMSTLLSDRLGVSSVTIPLMIPISPSTLTSTPGHGQPLVLLWGGHISSRTSWPGLSQALDGLHRPLQIHVTGSSSEVSVTQFHTTNGLVEIVRHGWLSSDDYLRVAGRADIHLVMLAEHATGTSVPSKAYSAMAAGRPVLYCGSRRGQVAADVIDAEAGWVAESAAELQDLLEVTTRDARARDERGRNGRAFASEHRSAAALLPVWREVLGIGITGDG